jgi:LPS export ABC transporter protein LptC
MASWQKRVRLGVAVFGLVFGVIVYSAIQERQPAAPPEPVRRADPKSIAEIYSAVADQLSGGERNYEISFERYQQYEDGSSRLFNVRVSVPNRGGRAFVISAIEGYTARGETELRMTGDVKVSASDGFELTTGDATFDQNTGIARASGPVAFRKGRMSGTGIGMMYDQPNDVLRFDRSSRVLATDDDGRTVIDFSAGIATLDRLGNTLKLEEAVHVIRQEEVIDADRALARLTETDDVVTYLELRGNARVSGGTSGISSMSARDIDLDYTDDGETLERVTLHGSADVDTAGAGDDAPGREMSGERLDLALAPDSSLTRVDGQGGVRLGLPPADGAPGRSIEADTLAAAGEPGKGLTSATFTSAGCGLGDARALCVVYREGERSRGAAARDAGREARSRRLAISLVGDAVTGATFTGLASFGEQGLAASAAEAVYIPDRGTLRLSGRDAGGGPRVEEEQVTVEAADIEVLLESRRMTADGNVKTDLRALSPRGAAPQSSPTQASRMPQLLKPDETVHLSAEALDYQGSAGKATYTGNAVLSQGTSTTIRGTIITLDRGTGDLAATGGAVSRLELDTGRSIGRAHEIRYDDARRTVAYSAPPVAPRNASGATAPPGPRVQVNSPEGDVTAQRIVVLLAKEDSSVDRLEAFSDVRVVVGGRTAAGARLTFHAMDGRYEMESAPGVPVWIADKSNNSCTETTGSALTFFKGTDRMIVDGKEFMRTQTKGGGPCRPIPLSR